MALALRVLVECPVTPAVQVAPTRARSSGGPGGRVAFCPSCGSRLELVMGPAGLGLAPARRHSPPSDHRLVPASA